MSWVMGRPSRESSLSYGNIAVSAGHGMAAPAEYDIVTGSGRPGDLAAGLLDGDGGIGPLDQLGHLEEVIRRAALPLRAADEEVADELMVAGAEERLVRHQPDFRRQLHAFQRLRHLHAIDAAGGLGGQCAAPDR